MTEPSGAGAADVSVVMVCYGPEPWLADAVHAVLASTGVRVELVLVDNRCSNPGLAQLAAHSGVTLVSATANLGFAGGVDLGAEQARGQVLALVNSDAVVAPDALARLAAHLADPAVGVAGGLVVLADRPELVNSAGNPLHVLGLSWAGGMQTPVDAVPAVAPVASASGALLALRRDLWHRLGGFAPEYFAYVEDLELCWRVWQCGLRVEVLAAATAIHHYEFARNDRKMYLLERNRLIFVSTAYGARTLAVLALPLLALEVAMALLAARQGWLRAKIRGWCWVAAHIRWIRRRRATVQRTRLRRDRELAGLWSTRVDPVAVPLPAGAGVLEGTLAAYWRFVRRVL